MNEVLTKLPLASGVFLVYAVVGAIMVIDGAIDYGAYATNLLAVGVACGALGIPRAFSKATQGVKSFNLLGFIESVPIPEVVFAIFLGVSSVLLAIGHIDFGAFSENVMKVGLACGALRVARATETYFLPRSGVSAQ